MRNTLFSLLFSLLVSTSAVAQERQLAITIDDLPFVGSGHDATRTLQRQNECFKMIMQTLVDHGIPATGFIVAGTIKKGQWELLEEFRNHGFQLGNHTYTHLSLDHVSSDRYIKDIAKAEQVLAPLMTTPKYFRYPYLAEGRRSKKNAVHQYLAEQGLVIAPVTIDSKDYLFNQRIHATADGVGARNLEQLKQKYLAYIWKETLVAEQESKNNGEMVSRQVLLIHANLLNSQFLGDIIDMYEQHGYRIVSLDDILNQASDLPTSADLTKTIKDNAAKAVNTFDTIAYERAYLSAHDVWPLVFKN